MTPAETEALLLKIATDLDAWKIELQLLRLRLPMRRSAPKRGGVNSANC